MATLAVTTTGPSLLRLAADLIRSGRADALTPEWRERVANACEDAAAGTVRDEAQETA